VKVEVAWNWLHLHILPRLRMSGAVSPFPGTPSCAQGQLTVILWSVWRRWRQLSNWASKLRFIDECLKGRGCRGVIPYPHSLLGGAEEYYDKLVRSPSLSFETWTRVARCLSSPPHADVLVWWQHWDGTRPILDPATPPPPSRICTSPRACPFPS
jgi:hypothetical protein